MRKVRLVSALQMSFIFRTTPQFHSQGAPFMSSESSDNRGPTGLGSPALGAGLLTLPQCPSRTTQESAKNLLEIGPRLLLYMRPYRMHRHHGPPPDSHRPRPCLPKPRSRDHPKQHPPRFPRPARCRPLPVVSRRSTFHATYRQRVSKTCAQLGSRNSRSATTLRLDAATEVPCNTNRLLLSDGAMSSPPRAPRLCRWRVFRHLA